MTLLSPRMWLTHKDTHTHAFGPISHKLKHLKSEEALQEDANIRTDSEKFIKLINGKNRFSLHETNPI